MQNEVIRLPGVVNQEIEENAVGTGGQLRAHAKIKSQIGFNGIVPLGENIVRVVS